jgi:hypothetical protein
MRGVSHRSDHRDLGIDRNLHLSQGDEDSMLRRSYYSFANTIDDAAEVHKINLFTTMRSFSNTISNIATNSEFPFVTVPTFEVLAAAARQQSGLS